jgi:hypothetical protein
VADETAPFRFPERRRFRMHQTLHLVIVDRDRRAALAAGYGSRWLLPVLTCSERARTAPLIARWCAERGVTGDVAGQWLGQMTSRRIDWLGAFAATSGSTIADPSLEWMPIETFSSSRSVIDYQQWALDRTLAHHALLSVDGPFGNLSWPVEVRSWIADATGSDVAATIPFRASAHEVVLGADCAHGRVYVKGLAGERESEVRLTQVLEAAAPASFARTLALERRPDSSILWLTAACPGTPGGNTHRAAQALARIQQRLLATDVPRALNVLDLDAAARWAGGLLADSACDVGGAFARVNKMGAPLTWIPMDLDPANFLVDDEDRVRFIDVDDSFLGPAPLAVATLALRCGDRTLYRTYERSWSPPLTGLDWAAFEMAATVTQSWVGWTCLERNIARGEVFIDRDLAAARVRARLAGAIDGISPSRARRAGREA